MVCIYCSGPTRVTNSRPLARVPGTWRRRACKSCVAQFSTLEQAEYSGSLAVRRSNKQIEPFLRDKLYLSLHRALGHRPTAITDASALTDSIIGKILHSPRLLEGFITPTQLAQTSYATLKRFDSLAASTYKAYHQASLRPA